MIWWADTKTLMKRYVKRSTEEVYNTNFLILSSKITCTDLSENTLNVYNVFLCVNTLKGVGLTDKPNSTAALDGFTKFLLNSPRVMLFLSTIFQNDFESGEDTLFVTTPEERNVFGMETFTEAIYNLFGYKINEYPEEPEYSYTDVLERLIHYGETADDALFDKLSVDKRLEKLGEKTKKEIKKMAKATPGYIDGMSKADMIELVLQRKSRW